MSLRTSDRPTALRLGVGALSVFEELLSRETADGLIYLMEHIIQELNLDPQDMTRQDIIRRRALQVIDAKLIRRVGDAKVVLSNRSSLPRPTNVGATKIVESDIRP
jgi:hypothetical protein